MSNVIDPSYSVFFISGKNSFNSGKRLRSSTSITANLLIFPVTIPTFTSVNLLYQPKTSSLFAFLYWKDFQYI